MKGKSKNRTAQARPRPVDPGINDRVKEMTDRYVEEPQIVKIQNDLLGKTKLLSLFRKRIQDLVIEESLLKGKVDQQYLDEQKNSLRYCIVALGKRVLEEAQKLKIIWCKVEDEGIEEKFRIAVSLELEQIYNTLMEADINDYFILNGKVYRKEQFQEFLSVATIEELQPMRDEYATEFKITPASKVPVLHINKGIESNIPEFQLCEELVTVKWNEVPILTGVVNQELEWDYSVYSNYAAEKGIDGYEDLRKVEFPKEENYFWDPWDWELKLFPEVGVLQEPEEYSICFETRDIWNKTCPTTDIANGNTLKEESNRIVYLGNLRDILKTWHPKMHLQNRVYDRGKKGSGKSRK